ncbi:MAG: BamA/TamA family outer membrane protein [Muribaculaceae bacterium]|nr:BamA/TamA family outer membrane protein [Muribaculaceae bacterium]
MKKLAVILFITLTYSALCSAQELSADTLAIDSLPNQKQHKNLYDKVIDYFNHTNDVKPQKDFDFSFIGGPHYSSDTKFGIGAVAAGVYRADRSDTITQPSNISIYFDATTSLFFKLGVRGTHFFPGDRRRWSYDVNFASVNTKFWGIGYENCVNNDNESKYKYLTSRVETEFVWLTLPELYIGPKIAFDYVNGRDFSKPELLNGEDHRTFNLGAGFTVQYDTRDNMTATTHGIYLKLEQLFNPRFLANKYAFSQTELTASGFHPLWRGAILAANLHARFTYGNTPWGLLSTLGGSYTMRGYFEGRYRDKSEIDICLELRQHIWRRNGAVIWVGGGTIFPEFSAIRLSRLLPNYGIGYRWEFKRFINVRLDLGFGKGQTGFIFSINEAF